MMSPGVSNAHDRISSNILATLHNRFHGKTCRVFTGQMRMKISRTRYVYPDVSALCGKTEFKSYKGVDMLCNPSVVFEVLSPTTEAYDLGKKFWIYQGIDSLVQYVCMWQHERRVANHVRRGSEWIVSQIGDTLALPSLDCILTSDEIYEAVELASAEQPGVP